MARRKFEEILRTRSCGSQGKKRGKSCLVVFLSPAGLDVHVIDYLSFSAVMTLPSPPSKPSTCRIITFHREHSRRCG